MNTILKTPYILIAFTLLLMSCNQEDMPVSAPDLEDRMVVFHTSIPGMTTKAESITKDLEFFRLTVFDESDSNYRKDGKLDEYVKNVLIQESFDSNRFFSRQCLWPDLKHESDILHFFSYYPALPDGASPVNNTSVSGGNVSIGYGINDFSIASDIARQVDFVTAYATGSMIKDYTTGVRLNFSHQLCRVEVKAKEDNKICDIEVAGVAFCETIINASYYFQNSSGSYGRWNATSKGNTEYIFRRGDAIVSVGSDPVSIMGSKLDDDNDNCAMLIPSTYSAWAYSSDAGNDQKGLYLKVLLRVIDATNTEGKGQQRYPYTDNSQGLNSPNIPVVYLVVDRITGKNVSRRLFKNGNRYFIDEGCKVAYTPSSNEMVKEFGWAALPISGNWQPGYTYTYTLDYSYGVGLHGPDVTGDVAPKAGDPIISDRVGVSMSVRSWSNGGTPTVTVPES